MRLFRILLILAAAGTSAYSQESRSSVIKFKDITVTIHSLSPLKEGELEPAISDKFEFMADLGEEVESSVVTVQAEKYKDIEIYQVIETSVTIMDEGPHCDLTNWKHFTSDWRKLKVLKPNSFQITSYSTEEGKKFPSVTMEEVIEAAQQQCGESWAKHIKDTKSIYDYPCDVGVSRYMLKLVATDKVNGKKIERMIIVKVPMGC